MLVLDPPSKLKADLLSEVWFKLLPYSEPDEHVVGEAAAEEHCYDHDHGGRGQHEFSRGRRRVANGQREGHGAAQAGEEH